MGSAIEELEKIEQLEAEWSRILTALDETRARIHDLKRQREALVKRLGDEGLDIPPGERRRLLELGDDLVVAEARRESLESRLAEVEKHILLLAEAAPGLQQQVAERVLKDFTERELRPAIAKLEPVLNKALALAMAAGAETAAKAIVDSWIPDPTKPHDNLLALCEEAPTGAPDREVIESGVSRFRPHFWSDKRARKAFEEHTRAPELARRAVAAANRVRQHQQERETLRFQDGRTK